MNSGQLRRNPASGRVEDLKAAKFFFMLSVTQLKEHILVFVLPCMMANNVVDASKDGLDGKAGC